MAYPIPPRPSTFSVTAAAPGCQRIPNLYARDKMGRKVDVLVVHTNWAGGEGTIESAMRWSLANPGTNTYAHYQHDRDGRAAKMLDSDRRGIGTAGVSSYWRDTHGLPNASYRTLTYETADAGTRLEPAPTGSYFTDKQMMSLARDLAYEAIVHDVPPVLLKSPEGRGIAGHCFPFPYPVFTTAKGKLCPGHRKFDQLVEVVIPWTAAIVNAWQSKPTPAPAPVPVPVPPSGDWRISDVGLFRLSAGEWPWSVAELVYGDGRRHPELTKANPTARWMAGERIWVPGTAGVLGQVRSGDSLSKLVGFFYGAERAKVLTAAAVRWNGGTSLIRVGEVVFLPAEPLST